MVRKNIPVNTKSKNLSILGGRLAFERESLNFTIVDFALHCGVTKQTQIKYEAGDNYPDTRYLERADQAGADIMYILTGSRTYEAMSDEHRNLIDAYADAPAVLKRAAFAVLLSPYVEDYKKAQGIPGYHRYEIKGEEDARYEAHLSIEKTKPEKEK
ncbi:MAG: helix-turn-helix transcriptional regulator [Nitrosomonadales bacterium]|nr:helix-turn-helix transcriptional regulator [Nitrosomonadales bacterium]